LGGIYALERIARDSPKDQWTIVEILSAFIRHHAPAPAGTPDTPAPRRELKVLPSLRTDVQAALTVLGRRSPLITEPGTIDLSKTDLARANLKQAHLGNASLSGAYLEGASLIDANLERTNFEEAHLEGAVFLLACLKDASLREAHLEGATLWRADLTRAHMRGAVLLGADFTGAIVPNGEIEFARLDKNSIYR
jgi:uncharacterized protein YjbI with pentapeptide repeats